MSEQASGTLPEIVALTEALASLDTRVARLEALRGGQEAAVPEVPSRDRFLPPNAAEQRSVTSESASGTEEDSLPNFAEMAAKAGANLGAGLVGLILLVLAGGYLLRALAESGVLRGLVGIATGLGYALLWALISHVMGCRGRRTAATACGLASTLVALPLIWEATTRFGSLSPWPSAALLLSGGFLLLAIGERHRLGLMSSVTMLSIGIACFPLTFNTRHPEPFALVLLLFGVLAAVVGPRRGGLVPWLGYFFGNLSAVRLFLVGSLGQRVIDQPVAVALILTGFFAVTMSIFGVQSGRTGKLGAQRAIQGTLVSLIGFGGGLMVARSIAPGLATAIATAGVLIGSAAYALVLITFRWSREHRWPYLLYSSLALCVAAISVAVLYPKPVWIYSGSAILLALLGQILNRVSPSFHASLTIVLAVAVGDLGRIAVQALASPSARLPEVDPLAVFTLIAAWFCAFLPLKVQSPVWPVWLPRLGRAAVILVAILGLDALLVQVAAPALCAKGATWTLPILRTCVLTISVVVTAGLAQWSRMEPARRLVWPLLVLLAIKLLAEDIPTGEPLTVAIALLLYGVSMILSTRLIRRSKTGTLPA